jgi:cellulose synthase/poly-beta-1,6-N-acetylglucosamine synthase-like glycosyltransferase
MKNLLNSTDIIPEFSLNEISYVLINKIAYYKINSKIVSFSYDENKNTNFLTSKQEFYDLILKTKEKELKDFCLKRRFFNLNFFQKIKYFNKKSIIYFVSISFGIFFKFNFIFSILIFFTIFALVVKLFAIIKGIYLFENKKSPKKTKKIEKYSILVPLYQEEKMINQIINSLQNLECKDVEFLIVIEDDDEKTKNALLKIKLPENFILIKVPYFNPRTKPKALNYAIKFTTGDVICVYDAEDIPDKDQLQKAKEFFSSSDVDVLQAVLSFYNYKKNLLTLCFNFEYVSWFYFLFRGYSSLKINCPLGGTSNHILKNALLRCGYWNSFNVTEDLELSILLTKFNFKIRFLNSFTQEQCVYTLKSWFKQRIRWMKGYYLSYFSNLFNFSIFDFKNFIYFHFIVGFSACGFILMPLIFLIIYFNFNNIGFFLNINVFSFISYFLSIIFFLVCIIFPLLLVLTKIKAKNIFNICKIFISYPLYFILHFFSSIFAIIDLIKRPYFWDKTKHNLLFRS